MTLVPLMPSVEELAAQANSEHRLVIQAGFSMVDHAIRAGEALLAAKARCQPGGWGRWLEANFEASSWTAKTYCKLATHQAIVRADLEQPTITQALTHLRTLPGTNLKRIPDDVRAEALQLIEDGVPRAEVARRLGINPMTIRDWTDPEYNARRRRNPARPARRPAIRPHERAGPNQLAVSIRTVTQARAAKDNEALKAALEDLAATALAWAETLAEAMNEAA